MKINKSIHYLLHFEQDNLPGDFDSQREAVCACSRIKGSFVECVEETATGETTSHGVVYSNPLPPKPIEAIEEKRGFWHSMTAPFRAIGAIFTAVRIAIVASREEEHDRLVKEND